MDTAVVADLLSRLRHHSGSFKKRAESAVNAHLNGHNTGISRTLSHANNYMTKIIVPSFQAQHPAWRDRFNNGCALLLAGLDYAVDYARRNA